MGWTSLHRERGITDRQFFEQKFPDTLMEEGEILDCATVGGVYYAAVQQKDSGEVWALVVLVRRGRGHYNFAYKALSETDGPFEARCPHRIVDLLSPLPGCSHEQEYCCLCSTEITPAGDQWLSHARSGQSPEGPGLRCQRGYPYGAEAADGGAPFHKPGGIAPCRTCRARRWRERCRANAERQARARTVRAGTCVRFAKPLLFGDGQERDTFVFVARSTFRANDSDLRFRIPNWRTAYSYEVVDPIQP
ncbi:DUF6927 domain-containing protein [Nonomuraea jabiensis]|uniref:DUF6927 domain-containing protein n=1 Tax=Nonomuraea jabiensis TaxID=882448 RepID=UPI003D7061E6